MHEVPDRPAWHVLVLALALGGLLSPALAGAAPTTDPRDPSGKIASWLGHVAGSLATGGGAGVAAPYVETDARGRVRVRVRLARLDAAVLARLRAAGMEVEIENRELRAARGWIDASRLAELAGIDEVIRVTRPDYRRSNAGAVEGEHDAALGCDDVRARLGIDGTGVRVGVISDGVDSIASSQASGDAPDVVVPTDARCRAGEGDEGSAMIELVHDCAPGAAIGFCGPLDDLEMVDCLHCLADSFGADVIVDDLGFIEQPYFEDGSVTATVDEVASQGVAYFSAAGNYSQSHYQGMYVHCPDASTRHDFGSGDCSMEVDFSQAVLIVLQWDEPFGGASSDYDLCVTGEGCSSDKQDGDDDPIESLAVGCAPGLSCRRELEISRFTGVDRNLEVYFFPVPRGRVRIEHDVPEDSIFGHPCAAGAVAVGAIDVSEPGNDQIEPFSSRGPCTEIAPAGVRAKPDVAGLDGISNTRPGGFPSPFFGTSAAAPGIAAVAALLLDFDPSLTPAAVGDVLRGSAVDLGTPGFDSSFGTGRVDAAAAIAAITSRPTPTQTPTAIPTGTSTRTRTPKDTPTPGPCVGDCDGNGAIGVDELVTAVRIALAMAPMEECAALDANRDGTAEIDDVVRAVNASLYRCVASAAARPVD